MLFSSPIFLFAFLPVILIAYYIFPSKARNLLLLVGSLFFYAWGEPSHIGVLATSILFNYVAGIAVERLRDRAGKWIFGIALFGNIALLGTYKYLRFFIENLNELLSLLAVPPLAQDPVHFPLGVSFFTFKALSYLFDIYRGKVTAQKSIIDVGLYIAFFPHLLAGPIARFEEIADSLKNRAVTPGLFVSGIERFILGLAKKMLIANPLGGVADQIFALPVDELTFGVTWLGIVCFTLQIYFDFSGYSDMAIGIGRMFGFSIRENFNFPYIATTIREFWRRWHISLSTWFRDYLYIPLGGGRCKPWRVYANLCAVFFLCGLWHGASWNFVLWGMIHGLFIVFERIGLDALLAQFWRPVRHLYALLVVTVAWVFFRAETLPYAVGYVKALFGLGAGDSVRYYPELYLTGTVTATLVAGIVLSAPVYPFLRNRVSPILETSPFVYLPVKTVVLGVLLFLSVLYMAANTYNPFIYFQF